MMRNRITAETTDEQILSQISTAKDSLVIEATEAASSEYHKGKDLVRAAQAVRNAEALASAQLNYRDVLKNKPENGIFFLANVLGRGADDTWSGRDNESARSAFDVVREWAANEIDEHRYSAR